MAYTFLFDSDTCSGCKACQAACKDRNQLPKGVLWRRVYEVAGGQWQKQGQAWVTDVYAYYLSMSCNHCEYPKCAGVCPTQAYTIRPEGIVLLDPERCMGCGYCGWACPYGAPQYDPQAGIMTKCNFCLADLQIGQSPACVAACPLRSLEYAALPGSTNTPERTQAVPPMPDPISRNPRFYIKPHHAMAQAHQGDVRLSNQEEIHTRLVGRFEETPLVAFTLLTQMAVGSFFVLWLNNLLHFWKEEPGILRSDSFILLSIGLTIFLSLLLSFRHLGNPRKAWLVFSHLRKSWLSREILFTCLFGIFIAFITVVTFFHETGTWVDLLWVSTILSGLIAIRCMAGVYRLQTVPAWNTWRTPVAFYSSSLLLGFLWVLMLSYLSYLPKMGGFDNIIAPNLVVLLLLFAVPLLFTLDLRKIRRGRTNWLRLSVILICLVGSIGLTLFPAPFRAWMIFPLLVLTAIEEVLGRDLFYKARKPGL